MFSIRMDATQGLRSKDRCVSALRYVSDAVHEGVIAAIDWESSSGQYFIDLVKQTLEKMDIDIEQCAGDAMDDAANTPGQYSGYAALRCLFKIPGDRRPLMARAWRQGLEEGVWKCCKA